MFNKIYLTNDFKSINENVCAIAIESPRNRFDCTDYWERIHWIIDVVPMKRMKRMKQNK